MCDWDRSIPRYAGRTLAVAAGLIGLAKRRTVCRRWIIAQESVVETAVKPPQDQAQRLEASRKFAVEVANLAKNTRCHDVMALEMSGISPITDFYVIATGTSARQMRGVR